MLRWLSGLVLVVPLASCNGGGGGGGGSGGGGGAAGSTSPYDELCEVACQKKDDCGLLNPTTLDECEFGCVETLKVTLTCTPSAGDISTCETESAAADCQTVVMIGGPVPCSLCP